MTKTVFTTKLELARKEYKMKVFDILCEYLTFHLKQLKFNDCTLIFNFNNFSDGIEIMFDYGEVSSNLENLKTLKKVIDNEYVNDCYYQLLRVIVVNGNVSIEPLL